MLGLGGAGVGMDYISTPVFPTQFSSSSLLVGSSCLVVLPQPVGLSSWAGAWSPSTNPRLFLPLLSQRNPTLLRWKALRWKAWISTK